MIKDSTGMILRGVSIFSVRNAEYLHAQIDTIQIEDCWDEGGVKSKEEIEEGLNIEITRGEYNKLKTVLNRVVRKFQPVVEMIEKAETVGEFLGSVLKGSRKLRNIMSGRGSKKYRDFRMESIRPIRTMWEQLGVQMEDKLISNSMGIWRVRELECNIRQFAFRYNQGMVHGNTVISHFGEVDRYCTFCKIRKTRAEEGRLGRELEEEEREIIIQNVPEEDRNHIFWGCGVVQETIQRVYKAVWDVEENVGKKKFLMGKDMGNLEFTLLYGTINTLIRYRIWCYKLAGALPGVQSIVQDIMNGCEKIAMNNTWRIMLLLLRQRVMGLTSGK